MPGALVGPVGSAGGEEGMGTAGGVTSTEARACMEDARGIGDSDSMGERDPGIESWGPADGGGGRVEREASIAGGGGRAGTDSIGGAGGTGWSDPVGGGGGRGGSGSIAGGGGMGLSGYTGGRDGRVGSDSMGGGGDTGGSGSTGGTAGSGLHRRRGGHRRLEFFGSHQMVSCCLK